VEADGRGLWLPAQPAQLTAESQARSALLPHAVLATGDDQTMEPAALLGTQTARSLLAASCRSQVSSSSAQS
jgi:hypothetical protein